MATAGGREADRVSVRVVPDTSRFAIDLRRELTRIESSLRVGVHVDADLDGFTTDIRARLAALRDETVHVDVDVDRDGLAGLRTSLTRLGRDGGRAGGPLAAVTRSMASLRGAALTALPNIAGLAAGLVHMAPAAGVAATGLLAVASAGAAIKIGTAGVADVLKGDADALARLAPSARAFVTEVGALKPAWQGVQASVQAALFKDLGATLAVTASSVLPVLNGQLTGTAQALNLVARNVLNTATGLSDSGALGTALKSANLGLKNLSALPGVLLQGLVQVGAAAGPSFERLTAAGGQALERLSERMNNAFHPGTMQAAIEGAVSLVRQLFTTLGNLGTAFGNIFGPPPPRAPDSSVSSTRFPRPSPTSPPPRLPSRRSGACSKPSPPPAGSCPGSWAPRCAPSCR